MAHAYAELQASSNFSFLRGASHPGELVETASDLGLTALALTDRNSLAGIVRAHAAARHADMQLIVASRLDLTDGPSLLVMPTDRQAYGRLTRLLTLGKRRAKKGACHIALADVYDHAQGQVFIQLPPADWQQESLIRQTRAIASDLGAPCFLAASHLYQGDDRRRLARLAAVAESAGTPLVATNDVHYHVPARRPLQDVLTCIREHCTITEAGFRLAANSERHLKSPADMARLFAGHEAAIARTVDIARACRFNLDELRYNYPEEPVPPGETPQSQLEKLTWAGAGDRYPAGLPDRIVATIRKELTLIARLGYAPYFLTVHDIVHWARAQNILCQGRGSAANSIVCYCLSITSVNPDEIDLLFERFISEERNEPPDIDVDFEHERREEVMQYIYDRYGRERAGIAATVITYRSRSAVREVGKAMGLSADTTAALAGNVWGWSSQGVPDEQVRQAGLDPADPLLRRTLALTRMLIGFPRHLSQHVGGFVLTQDPLSEVIPIGNAAMADRTFVEWDKNDLDVLGILKIDVLALGMLTCLRKAFALLETHYGKRLSLAAVPRDDPATYQMIQKADTVGVFQIESRAQMSMLPRLRPANMYDLVIEVAIVRPGPIQGGMVHPYLRRRQGLEKVEYPSEGLRSVLEKTLGVPLFQEQAMKIAIIAAGFTPGEADRLRRAMASFRHIGDIGNFKDKFIRGMTTNGYTTDFSERCFKQIEGFSDYGFPESHAASFALLAYASSWLKCHYPDVFTCALLNAQPMGFYSSSSLVRDFRDHGGETRPVDVSYSAWDHRLEARDPHRPDEQTSFALRLGLRQVKGLREEDAHKITAVRGAGFRNLRDFCFRTGLNTAALCRLAHADAFRSLNLDRRAATWEIRAMTGPNGQSSMVEALPLFAAADTVRDGPMQPEETVTLPAMQPGEHVMEDYQSLRLSLKAHPLSFLRPVLAERHIKPAGDLTNLPTDSLVRIAGLVLTRQRPGTASGVVFMTLEDETGTANIIVWPTILESHRRIVLGARMVSIEGRLQNEQGVIHVIARRLTDLTSLLLDTLQSEESGQPEQESRATASPHRHPRSVRALPKGRNFH
ncbi:MAG: error-prone DNA polymerase [Alphaproteobacteria bacterium]